MSLEIIRFGTPRPDRPPLLLIHGAYCGAWVWQHAFISYFEEQGWSGIAFSLSGHGQSEGLMSLDWLGVQDFVVDAERVMALLDRPPVVIGHSMGGLIAQVLASTKKVAGQVLLASVPPHGLSMIAQHMWCQDPTMISQLGAVLTWGGWSICPDKLSDRLFSSETPREQRHQYLNLFQRESSRAALEVMAPQIPHPPYPAPPTLVMGGDSDPFIPRFEMDRTATFWHTKAHIIRGLPHAMMLDSRWEMAAKPIVEWLEAL